jgi:hypothetical protein
MTYLELSEAEVADLDFEVVVNEDVVTLDVSVHYAEGVHVLEHDGGVSCDSDPCLYINIHLVFLHMQHVVQGALGNVLEHDVDIRNFRNDSHQDANARMTQDSLHDYFVLDFGEKLIGQPGVKYLFNCNGSSVELTHMDG